MKKPEAVAIARALAAHSDVIVENFATGVMNRLGLGADDLQALNPDLLYVSASGLGRTGPEARAVAYGTLLQCCAGFAGLNRHPDVPPRVGLAWLDPMCGLMLAFIVAAGLWHRRWAGGVARIDFSMIEAVHQQATGLGDGRAVARPGLASAYRPSAPGVFGTSPWPLERPRAVSDVVCRRGRKPRGNLFDG